MPNGPDELSRLNTENDRLIALLESHGIEWRSLPASSTPANQEPEVSKLSTAKKVALFRRLFRGRIDVYPVRWDACHADYLIAFSCKNRHSCPIGISRRRMPIFRCGVYRLPRGGSADAYGADDRRS